LPLHEAANIFTLAEFDIGGKSMELSGKQQEALETIEKETGVVGLFKRIFSNAKEKSKILDEAGVASKQNVMKTEDGFEYPARCYAYVPDPQQVSTWKLRMCAPETTEITREQLGAAAAAFSEGGFRGNRVELPEGAVEDVRHKIRSKYEELGVNREDMPESIKAYEKRQLNEDTEAEVRGLLKGKLERVEMIQDLFGSDQMDADAVAEIVGMLQADMEATQTILSLMGFEEKKNMDEFDELVEKFEKSMHGDMEDKMGEMLSEMQKAEADQMALVRQLAEMVTKVPEEEVRGELEAIIEEMQAMLSEDESAMEADEEEKESVDVDKLTKSVFEALEIDKLSELLQSHNKMIEDNGEAVKGVAGAIDELVDKIKSMMDRVEALESKAVEVEKTAKELQKSDEKKVAEKVRTRVPFWGSQYQASKAAETELSDEDAKQYAEPEIPSTIRGVAKRIAGGK
jgi:hypothetical protein